MEFENDSEKYCKRSCSIVKKYQKLLLTFGLWRENGGNLEMTWNCHKYHQRFFPKDPRSSLQMIYLPINLKIDKSHKKISLYDLSISHKIYILITHFVLLQFPNYGPFPQYVIISCMFYTWFELSIRIHLYIQENVKENRGKSSTLFQKCVTCSSAELRYEICISWFSYFFNAKNRKHSFVMR